MRFADAEGQAYHTLLLKSPITARERAGVFRLALLTSVA